VGLHRGSRQKEQDGHAALAQPGELMPSSEDLATKVAALDAFVRAVAGEYQLEASATLASPSRPDVPADEPSIEVVVAKRTSGAPRYYGKLITVRRYEHVGNIYFERFIRDEAAPKLKRL
jgi:hypothetical protein